MLILTGKKHRSMALKFILLFSIVLWFLFVGHGGVSSFEIEEATINGIHKAIAEKKLTTRKLVEFYLKRISTLNPKLNAVIEVNPDAVAQADAADKNRKGSSSGLQGIPILVKDNIATADKMNTTAGSLALMGSVVAGDAGVVEKLRKAGAIILGKASLTEWTGVRSFEMPPGWCARSGQGKNPYVTSESPCGSSSGSSISAAANLATVTIGTETDDSILCPSNFNSVVGMRPTVGLTSRSGVIRVSQRQDTVGPICRTVSDVAHVLDAIVGADPKDPETAKAAKFIPKGGYVLSLKPDGLKGKRLGVADILSLPDSPERVQTFHKHFTILKQKGATLVENLEIPHVEDAMNPLQSGEMTALLAELKKETNAYLSVLRKTLVKSLADIIKFNNKSPEEKSKEYGQGIFLDADGKTEIGEEVKNAVNKMERLSREGIEKVMKDKNLDAIILAEGHTSPILAIGGYPGITVPAGYAADGVPYRITFGGLRGSEPKLIEIAYGFEQATKVRKPPSLK
ncbi:hypothetical protein H6P81_018448 [Aristolochia fimbriata]|uniref:Amidase domain-containing protein n=1 Tax=Aristolochia fimbriata TaxID=158543 RepID=A0AAV7E1E7_ARIFI|nr:hypothetical protein H6P81_018448 [Aristolochia fimbriata]